MSAMTDRELAEFLRRPLVVSLTTIRPDGSPHSTPVWFTYDGERFRFIMDSDSVKARNVRRDARVSICIATHEEPYEYVVVNGSGEIGAEGVEELTRSLSVRYIGQERGPGYADKLLSEVDGVVLTVTPARMLTETAA